MKGVVKGVLGVLYAAGDRVEMDVFVTPKRWRRILLREKPRVERRVYECQVVKAKSAGEIVESE